MKELLQQVVLSPITEARWLNTLSLLEHTGARKINRTVGDQHPSLEILRHLSNEMRHAYIFRYLSEKLAPHSGYLCADEAVSYFQMLDTTLSEWITDLSGRDDPTQNYLLVTSTIERRAMQLYLVYKNLTASKEVREELEKIIIEDEDHRQIIEGHLRKILGKLGVKDSKHCQRIEDQLFGVFVSSLTREVQQAKNPQSAASAR